MKLFHDLPRVTRPGSRAGQSLVEAIVAATVLTVGLLGAVGLLAQSLSLNRVITDNYIGTYLAAEGIEVMKNLIDAGALQSPPLTWGGEICPGSGGPTFGYEVHYGTQLSDLQGSRLGGNQESSRPLRYDAASGYQYSAGSATNFTRTVRVDCGARNSEHKLIVNSIVKWKTRGGGNFETNLEDHFYDWRP